MGGIAARTRDWRTLQARRFARLGRRPMALQPEQGVRMTVPMMRRSEVEVDGRRVRLTPAETEVVATLLAVRPRPLLLPDLADLVYLDREDGGALHQTLSVQILRLRQRGVPIMNRRGLGYLL